MRSLRRPLLFVVPICLASCASVEFTRDTQSSGTFTSVGRSFTLFAVDFPKGAMVIARENASDANMPNMEIQKSQVFPDFGAWNWLLDIVSFRIAKIEGTWGFTQ